MIKKSLPFKSSFGKVSALENNIIYTEFYSNEKFNIEEAKEIDYERFRLSQGKPFYSLVNLKSVYGHMTKDAQNFLANESKCSQLIKFEAIIINSLSIRILVKNYVRFAKPPYGIKIIKNYSDGVALLSGQVTDHDNRTQR